MKQPWSKAGAEPRIWDVLADPIVQSLMKADKITQTDVLRASAPTGSDDMQRRSGGARIVVEAI
jgi:hypothetical protein